MTQVCSIQKTKQNKKKNFSKIKIPKWREFVVKIQKIIQAI